MPNENRDAGTNAEKPVPPRRAEYRHFLSIPTRWMDNDVYGHVNNVVYYSYFDTVVNHYLVKAGGLDIERGPVIGLVVETLCRYFKPVPFPEILDAGLRVGRLGTSSVRYEIGIFRQSDEAPDAEATAAGHFVHVYVDRSTRRPVPVPEAMRRALSQILSAS